MIDGTGAPPRPDQTMVIAGDLIVEIGPSSAVSLAEDVTVLDGTGRWVAPGFVDLHVHLPPDSSIQRAILDRLLEFGVTTILNPGSRPGAGRELRDRLEGGELTGPRMRAAGPLIDVTPDGRGYGEWATQTPTEAIIREEVRRQAESGVDFVKLYAGLEPHLVRAAADEARLLGVSVIGHLESTPWAEAARVGVKMLVHSGWSTPMDELVDLSDPDATDAAWYTSYANAPSSPAFERLVQALIDSAVVVVPTLSITQAGALGRDARLLPEFRVDLAPERDLPGWWGEGWRTRHPQYGDTDDEEGRLLEEIYFPGVLSIHKAFFDRGVTLGVGTDVGNPWMTPGVSFHHELGLYQDAGIPALQILTMATRNGARALGLDASVGTIEVGKRADLVLFTADPSSDIRHSLEIERVFHGGREVVRR